MAMKLSFYIFIYSIFWLTFCILLIKKKLLQIFVTSRILRQLLKDSSPDIGSLYNRTTIKICISLIRIFIEIFNDYSNEVTATIELS